MQRLKPFFEHEKGALWHGDNEEVMARWPDDTFDTVVTDPQYGWKFMGKKWDYELPSIEQCEEILRVTKPGGFLFATIGNRTAHRITCVFEDAGWIILPSHIWLFAGSMPHGTDVSKQIDKEKGLTREKTKRGMHHSPGRKSQRSKEGKRLFHENARDIKDDGKWETAPASPEAAVWEGRHTGIKTAFELIMVAMKPPDGTFAQNAIKHGVAGFNIEECRLPVDDSEDLRRDHSNPKKSRCFGVFKGDGLKKEEKLKSGGRYPSNVYLDEETAEKLDRVSGVTKSGAIKKDYKDSKRGYHRGHKGGVKTSWAAANKGGASRFFWVAKAPQSQRHKGLPDDDYNDHPTVKPIELIRRLIRLTRTPTGGKILDPWAGSGTTLVASVQEGRHFTGIEQDLVSCKTAKKRLIQEIGSLFA